MTKKQNSYLENSHNSQDNSQKLDSEKIPENTLENTQKFPETLEEQRDYYLKLYQKWANWQQETPEKLPEGLE